MPPFGDNMFLDFLEEQPNVAFQASRPQGGSPASQRFFQNQFENIHNRFLGQLGQQILGGEPPTARFTDFLQDFDFGGFAASQSPFMRGEQQQRFAPSTRFLFF
jgi:hypothetical protein